MWTSKAEAFRLSHEDSKDEDEANRASLIRPQAPWKAGSPPEGNSTNTIPWLLWFWFFIHFELTRAWRVVSEPTASVFIVHQRVSVGLWIGKSGK